MARPPADSVVRLLSALGLVAAMAASVAGQSLGELGRKEEARRKSLKSPGKLLTNDSLGTLRPPSATPPAPSGQAAPAPNPSSGSPQAAATGKPNPEEDRKVQEAAWRQRILGARDTLQRSQMFADALQSRVNALTTDFTSRDDPAQRAVVASDRDKALAELERVKREVVQQTKTIADIQEEARRAGIPPGWLR